METVGMLWKLFLLYLLLPSWIHGDNILNVIDTNPNFSNLRNNLNNCLDCAPFTDPSGGILVLQTGAFIAPTNQVPNIPALDQAELGSWFFGNQSFSTLLYVPSVYSFQNDEKIMNFFGNPVIFNVYGTLITANGVVIQQELTVSQTQKIWTVTSKFILFLSFFYF